MKKSLWWATSGAIALICVTAGVTSTVAVAATKSRPPAVAAPAVQPAVATTPLTNAENLFVQLAPCRAVDTRSGGGTIASGVARDFYLAGSSGFTAQGGASSGCGVPLNASAVAVTVTAVSPTHTGYLRLFGTGGAEPTSAFMNYGTAYNVSGYGTTPISTGGQARLRNESSTTQIIIDITGYYIPQIEAEIGGDGSFNVGSSRIVSVQHAGTGFYYVTLDRPARSCVPTVSTYNIYRYASVGYSSSTTPNVISVSVWYLNGSHTETSVDFDFMLHVSC